ncbi:hypothetical protein [Caldicellulosiruptor bescii]|uniref:hypothetical protein n=1 Tax=Caldicellulosiruptor bescii TaxID=31899 RepID=UPI001E2B1581|nr:hypothetical protein [Caldicellulosiruptor bescii]
MQNNNPNFNPFDVMVDIGECYAKVVKLPGNEKELCSDPECIENAEYVVVYEDGDEKFICAEDITILSGQTLFAMSSKIFLTATV